MKIDHKLLCCATAIASVFCTNIDAMETSVTEEHEGGGVLAQHTTAVDQLSLDEAISHFQVNGEKEFIRAIKRVIPVIEATARECLPLLQQLEEKLPGISYITNFEKMDETSKQLVFQLRAKLDKAVTTLGFLGTLECEHYSDGRTKEAITSYIYTPKGTNKSYLATMGTFNLMKKALVTARSKFFHGSWIIRPLAKVRKDDRRWWSSIKEED